MREWWISSLRMTFWVATDGGTIVGAAPIGRRFLGQPFGNLLRWMEKQGGLRFAEIMTNSLGEPDSQNAEDELI